MKKLVQQFAALGKTFYKSIGKYPLEALLGLIFFLIFLFGEQIDKALEGTDLFNLFLWFFPLYVLLFTIHRLSKSYPSLKILYVITSLLWIPLMLWCTIRPGAPMAIAWLIAACLLAIGERAKDNDSFGRDIIHTLLGIAVSMIIGIILAGAVCAILASVNFLFKLELSDMWFTTPIAFTAFFISPLLCCLIVGETTPHGKRDGALAVIVDYILSPALVIYSLVLYAYTLLIVIRWELPDGGVAYMVLAFLCISMACYLFRYLLQKRHFEWFYQYFPFIAAVPIALLWVGVFRRIGEYGITEARFYLFILMILVTVFILMLLGPRSRKFQLMTFILAVTAAIFTYIPGIRAKDFGIRSQRARLENLLPGILENGQFPERFDYSALAADKEQSKVLLSAWSSWDYLRSEMDPSEFESTYGPYGSFDLDSWRLENEAKGAENEYSDYSSVILTGPVDLGAYTILLSPESYFGISDDGNYIIYTDRNRTQTLLTCPFKERIEAMDEDTPPERILIYKNERYMAVFSDVYISEDYYPGTVNLFMKP